MKKILSSILCVMLIVTMMPVMAFADGEESVGSEYRFEVGYPSQLTTWIPDTQAYFWTNLEQRVQEEGDENHWYWTNEGVDYTIAVSAVPTPEHCENCAAAGDYIKVYMNQDEPGFDLEITGDYPIGCSVDVTVTAMVGGESVAAESFTIRVADTMYTINRGDVKFPNPAEMGTVINFKDNILLRKWTVAEDGRKEVTVLNAADSDAEYSVTMEYDVERWVPDGAGVKGLCNLKKITPYGANAVIHLWVGGENVASNDYGFGGYEYRVKWAENEPRMFTSEEAVTVLFEKKDDLAAAENCELSFKLGVWKDDHVEPFAVQTGLCAVTEAGEGLILYPAAIGGVMADELEENGDAWFEIQPYVTCNGVTAPINQSLGCVLLESRVEYDYPGDREMMMYSGEGIGKEIWGFLCDEEHQDGEERWLKIIGLKSDNTDAVVVTGNAEEGWGFETVGIGEATLTLTHEGFGTVVVDGEEVPELKEASFKVYVRDDLWECSVETENRTNAMHPGESQMFTLEAWHNLYDADDDNTYSTDEDYLVEWSLEDRTHAGVSITPSADAKSVTVSAASYAAKRENHLNYAVYALNEDGSKGVKVIEGRRNFRITDEYYSFAFNGFNEELAVNDTMTVTLEILHHIQGEEPAAVPAEFDCFDYEEDVLEIKTEIAEDAAKATYTIKRISGWETRIRFEAWSGHNGNDLSWGYGTWINRPDMGENVPAGQILWVEYEEGKNPPQDPEQWNDSFCVKEGTELTVHLAAANNGILRSLKQVEVDEWSNAGISVENLGGGVYTFFFEHAGTFTLRNDSWGYWYELEGEVFEGVSDETGQFYAYNKLNNGEYVRMNNVPVDGEEGYPAYFAGEFTDNEFYILWKAEGDVQAEDLQLDVFEVEGWDNRYVDDIDDGSDTGVEVELQDGLYQDAYYVWKITVGEDFDMAKTGMKLNALKNEKPEECEECDGCENCSGYIFVMWILGEDYSWCPEDSYNNGIYIVQEIPENKTWASLADVSSEWPEINLNLSETAKSERNTFYIIQKPGENTDLGLSQLHVYTITDSSGVGGGGFRVEKALDAGTALNVGTVIPVTIGGTAYEAVPVNLEAFLGHSHLYITAENSTGQLRACISFGLEVYFDGALDGIETVGPVWNDTNRLFGYAPEFPDFEIVKHDNGSISAYFEDACAIITDVGQGSVCTVSIDLKDGYVITDIHDGEEPFIFLADDSSLYNMWDADGNLLDSQAELDAVGWDGPRSGSSDQPDGTHKTAPGTVHRIATYGRDDTGYENVTYLKQFLDEKGFTAEKLGDFTDYNMYFDKGQYEGTDAAETIKIVFEVTSPENFKGTSFQVVGRDDIKLDADVLDEEEYDGELYNENVQQLHGEDREVKKVYEITETRGSVAGNGFICITISEAELDGGNLEDYTVVYFTEGGVPVEVKTTYIEGQGLVFTTGHFSTYAVIGKKLEDGEDEGGNTGGSTGGSGGGTTGGGSWYPAAPADSNAAAKTEAEKAVTNYVDAEDYDTAEADEIAAIITQAKADIQAAKSADEIKSIEEAAKAEIDKIETAAEKALIFEVESIKFKARSKATKLNGKKAIKVYWNVPEGMEFDGYDVFRSVKKNRGYGKKPFYTSKSNYYVNNKNLKTGKTYYYKVRGFKYVNDEKVYTKWSWKAWRTVK